MQIDSPLGLAPRRPEPFSRDELARAKYDERGTFLFGRRAELETLAGMGARDASLGRIYEGHCNGALLVALYGTDAQRNRAWHDVDRGELFGVWNTQELEDPVTIEPVDGRFVLKGAKTWASAAPDVSRALITARTRDGAIVMCLVPMDRAETGIDGSAWRPLGMHDSKSYRVAFDGVVLDREDLIGSPGDYERAPWFLGGAIRFAAVHTGVVERIVAETIAYVLERGRASDPLVRARIGEMRIAARSCVSWLRLAEEAWSAFDCEPSRERAEEAVDASDLSRSAIERAALDVLEHSIRTVGAHGMVEPLPFAKLFRDLHMYLRQPAPDAALLRVADRAIARTTAARSSAVAVSTG